MGGLEKKLSSSQMIILGFAMVILFGSLLLMLPVAIRDGQEVNFVDALFTATSAVCVTGLVVRDTATCWTGFGQAVILLLIQIGGMGVITVAVAIGNFWKKNQPQTAQHHARSDQRTSGRGNCQTDQFYHRDNNLFRNAGCCIYGSVFLPGVWYWQRNLVCLVSFDICFLQCRI